MLKIFSKLNNQQFVAISLVAILCGVVILGYDYFIDRKLHVYDQMSLVLAEGVDPGEDVPPEQETILPTPVNTTTTVATATTKAPTRNNNHDRSSNVTRSVTYNYVGRLIIQKIGLNKGFLKYGDRGNSVKYNVAVVPGSEYPTIEASNFILAAHNGTRSNAFFNKIPQLKVGDLAVVQYDHKQYTYKMVQRYLDKKSDHHINVRKNGIDKQLTLVTCNKDMLAGGGHTYDKNYLVLVFHLVSEIDCNGQC